MRLRKRQVETLRALREDGGEWPPPDAGGFPPGADVMDRVMRGLARAGLVERTGWAESARGLWYGTYRLTDEGRTRDLPEG